MSLKRGEVNPLNVLGMRRLDFIPKHFATIVLKIPVNNIKMLDQWISHNLNSRYAIKTTFTLDENKKLIEAREIGMEDPKELTMFSLGCPYINQL
jgi:hypothetical protein